MSFLGEYYQLRMLLLRHVRKPFFSLHVSYGTRLRVVNKIKNFTLTAFGKTDFFLNLLHFNISASQTREA